MKRKQHPKIKILNLNQNKKQPSNSGVVKVVFLDKINIYISIWHGHSFGIAKPPFHLQSLDLQTLFLVSLRLCVGLHP